MSDVKVIEVAAPGYIGPANLEVVTLVDHEAQVTSLTAELTKARELIAGLDSDLVHQRMQALQDLKTWAYQSAAAAKGDKCSDGGTCGLGGFCTNCHNLP